RAALTSAPCMSASAYEAPLPPAPRIVSSNAGGRESTSRLALPGDDTPLGGPDDPVEPDPGEAHDDVAHEDDIGAKELGRVQDHPADPRGRGNHLGGHAGSVGEADAHTHAREDLGQG